MGDPTVSLWEIPEEKGVPGEQEP
ncbi:hypothetical protein LCGC14_2112420, partial [marine sediment metagenome]